MMSLPCSHVVVKAVILDEVLAIDLGNTEAQHILTVLLRKQKRSVRV
jgi:hypothetical protein